MEMNKLEKMITVELVMDIVKRELVSWSVSNFDTFLELMDTDDPETMQTELMKVLAQFVIRYGSATVREKGPEFDGDKVHADVQEFISQHVATILSGRA